MSDLQEQARQLLTKFLAEYWPVGKRPTVDVSAMLEITETALRAVQQETLDSITPDDLRDWITGDAQKYLRQQTIREDAKWMQHLPGCHVLACDYCLSGAEPFRAHRCTCGLSDRLKGE